MQLAASDSEFLQQADVMKSVANDPDIKAALMRAEEDKQRAKALGIQRQDLPVVVFKERTFPNVSDLKKVLSSGDSK